MDHEIIILSMDTCNIAIMDVSLYNFKLNIQKFRLNLITV
jgi:hypothetical protein